MTRLRPLAVLIAATLFATSAPALDFSKIDRRVVREPEYRSKPLYALALLGPDGGVRVWLVVDGARLFVDRNCNGDLTDDGPPNELAEKATREEPAQFGPIEVSPDQGKTVYKVELTVWERPGSERFYVEKLQETQRLHVLFPDGRYFGAWGDQFRPLIFAPNRAEAPAIHFGGDLRMGFEVRKPLRPVKDGFELNVCVGTPGSCAGAWAHLLYDTIPKGAQPRATLEFPPEKAGQPPVRIETVLKKRC